MDARWYQVIAVPVGSLHDVRLSDRTGNVSDDVVVCFAIIAILVPGGVLLDGMIQVLSFDTYSNISFGTNSYTDGLRRTFVRSHYSIRWCHLYRFESDVCKMRWYTFVCNIKRYLFQ